MTSPEQVALFPTLRITLSSGCPFVVDPHHYMYEVESHVWCMGVYSDPTTVIGNNILQNQNAVFDLKNKQWGIAKANISYSRLLSDPSFAVRWEKGNSDSGSCRHYQALHARYCAHEEATAAHHSQYCQQQGESHSQDATSYSATFAESSCPKSVTNSAGFKAITNSAGFKANNTHSHDAVGDAGPCAGGAEGEGRAGSGAVRAVHAAAALSERKGGFG